MPFSLGPEGIQRRQELRVQAKLMNLLTLTHGYGDAGVEAAAKRVLDLCRSVADSDEEVLRALCGLATFRIVKGDLYASAIAVQAIVDLARTSGPATFTAAADVLAGSWHGIAASCPSHGSISTRRWSPSTACPGARGDGWMSSQTNPL